MTELNGVQSGLVANWHFDAASGILVADDTGHHHAALLNGAASLSSGVHP